MSTIKCQNTGLFKRSTRLNLAAISLAAIVMAGCSSTPNPTTSIAPITYQKRHPIVVDASPTVLDIPTGNARTHLTTGAKSAIDGFAVDYKRSGARDVSVLMPSGSSNDAEAAHLAHHAKRRLLKAGIPASRIRMRSYQAHSAELPGHLRFSFTAVKARVASECGVWPTNIANQIDNKNYENFGCATQSNLAAIIADPNDLIAPRGPGEINATRSTQVLTDFEAGTPPPVPPASSQSL